MKFHRFKDPTYPLGGGTFPGTIHGDEYDRINCVSEGAGESGSANADTQKVGGPNAGTYFAAYGEDATSKNINRGFRALAENTDYLDDLMHREQLEVASVRFSAPPCPNNHTPMPVTLPEGAYIGEVAANVPGLCGFLWYSDTVVPVKGDPSAFGPGSVVDDFLQVDILVAAQTESWTEGVLGELFYLRRSNLATQPRESLARTWFLAGLAACIAVDAMHAADNLELHSILGMGMEAPGYAGQLAKKRSFSGNGAVEGARNASGLTPWGSHTQSADYGLGAVWLATTSVNSYSDVTKGGFSGFVHIGGAVLEDYNAGRREGLFGFASFVDRTPQGPPHPQSWTYLPAGTKLVVMGFAGSYIDVEVSSESTQSHFGKQLPSGLVTALTKVNDPSDAVQSELFTEVLEVWLPDDTLAYFGVVAVEDVRCATLVPLQGKITVNMGLPVGQRTLRLRRWLSGVMATSTQLPLLVKAPLPVQGTDPEGPAARIITQRNCNALVWGPEQHPHLQGALEWDGSLSATRVHAQECFLGSEVSIGVTKYANGSYAPIGSRGLCRFVPTDAGPRLDYAQRPVGSSSQLSSDDMRKSGALVCVGSKFTPWFGVLGSVASLLRVRYRAGPTAVEAPLQVMFSFPHPQQLMELTFDWKLVGVSANEFTDLVLLPAMFFIQTGVGSALPIVQPGSVQEVPGIDRENEKYSVTAGSSFSRGSVTSGSCTWRFQAPDVSSLNLGVLSIPDTEEIVPNMIVARLSLKVYTRS